MGAGGYATELFKKKSKFKQANFRIKLTKKWSRKCKKNVSKEKDDLSKEINELRSDNEIKRNRIEKLEKELKR